MNEIKYAITNFEECPAVEPYVCVVCSINKGGCGASTGYQEGVEKAIAAWNGRADHLPDATKMVTNADRIRSMSDEELAAMMYSFGGLEMPDNYCQRKKECDDMLDSGTDIPDEKCIGCLIDWLRQKEEV